MKNEIRKDRAITLIALVITIIVLLILAGVSIATLTGENGILTKAKTAESDYSEKSAKEKLELVLLDLQADKRIDKKYNEQEYINNKIIKENMVVSGNIVIVDGWKFEIDRSVPKIVASLGKEEDKTLGYVQDGLVVWYDGIKNTKQGHDDKATHWENLAEGNQDGLDGELKNIDYTSQSGWTNNSLILDGVNDWVKTAYMHYDNITVEIVAKPLDVSINKYQYYITNGQNGGIGIHKRITSNENESSIYVGDGYKYTTSNNEVKIGQIYSMSTGYDGTNHFLRENKDIIKQTLQGTFGKPANSTVFAIGTNPSGTGETLGTTEARFNLEVYSVRIYNRCLTEEEMLKNYQADQIRFSIKELEEQKELGYIQDGLMCLYDGEQNTKYGHSKTSKVWMDLTENQKDGTVNNIDNTTESGWTNHSLILDGVNDWVKMPYMHYDNMTVEIVAKPLEISANKYQYYIANCEDGGICICKNITNNENMSSIFVGGGYKDLVSNYDIKIGQIYSMATGYDGTNQFLRENKDIFKQSIQGTFGKPVNSTVFAIGTNPGRTGEYLGKTDARFNLEVYSVRVYNRCLTEEELKHNYEIDQARFQINS